MADTRKSVRLSDSAQAGWDRCSKRHGLPLSIILEAMGRKLDEGRILLAEDVVELAHQIEFERRSRRRK